MRRVAALTVGVLTAVLLSVACSGAVLNEAQEALAGFRALPPVTEEVVVALIDTGVATERLDGEKLLPGRSYVSEDETDTVDRVGHGTRIASLILGAGDGEDLISPLAPNARIVPLVYYTQYPSGVSKNGGIEAICRGISDAVDVYAAEIIVISSGVYEDDPALSDCVAYAEERGVIVISAAGNDGDDRLVYPAAYDTVVSVGSVDGAGRMSGFSQRNGRVTVAAPGEDLWAVSLRNGDFFEKVNGTSYSCAYVAALAARLLGMYPEMTPRDVRWVLETSSAAIPREGQETAQDWGMLQAAAAVTLWADRGKQEGEGPTPVRPRRSPVHAKGYFLTIW